MIMLSHAARSHPAEMFSQDRRFESPETRTFGIFDGMGGKSGGDIAAEIACSSLQSFLSKILTFYSSEQVTALIGESLRHANAEVRANAHPPNGEMSTTALICHIWDHGSDIPHALVGHVGDSRAYILRGKKTLSQLTLDDGSLAWFCRNRDVAKRIQERFANIARDEELNDLEYALFKQREWLTKILGDRTIIPILATTPIMRNDRLLLSTDGIHDNLTDREIQDILQNTSMADEACERLLAAAHDRFTDDTIRSHRDDLTVIVIDIV